MVTNAALDAYLKAFRCSVESSCNAGISFAQRKTEPAEKPSLGARGILPELFSKESCLTFLGCVSSVELIVGFEDLGRSDTSQKEVTKDNHNGEQLLPSFLT